MKKIKNLKVRVAAVALIGTMTSISLVGCGNKNDSKTSFLSGTVLESSMVLNFEDGHKDIVSFEENCPHVSCDSDVYRSIITNEYISNNDCTANSYNGEYKLNHYDITYIESILSYLTSNDIEKAAKGELTEDDIFTIINRVLEKEETTKTIK